MHIKDYWEKHPQGTKRLVYGKKPTKYALALMRGDKQQWLFSPYSLSHSFLC